MTPPRRTFVTACGCVVGNPRPPRQQEGSTALTIAAAPSLVTRPRTHARTNAPPSARLSSLLQRRRRAQMGCPQAMHRDAKEYTQFSGFSRVFFAKDNVSLSLPRPASCSTTTTINTLITSPTLYSTPDIQRLVLPLQDKTPLTKPPKLHSLRIPQSI